MAAPPCPAGRGELTMAKRAARRFTANGRSYPGTPAGWLSAAKDEWKAELARAGHRPDRRNHIL
jgi:hypothetical protein